jgi:hypothetical protein
MSPSKLGFCIKRKRLLFRCPGGYPPEPRGHTPPAFLFSSLTMSNSRKGLFTLQLTQPTRSACRTPFRAVPATSSQCIRNSREVGGAGRHRVPQWCGLYEGTPLAVKHFVAKFLRLQNSPENIGLFAHARGGSAKFSTAGRGRNLSRRSKIRATRGLAEAPGGTTWPAAGSMPQIRHLPASVWSWLTDWKPCLAKLQTA